MEKKFYKIGETADLLGIEQYTLRYLENTLQLKIKRSERGDRLYTDEDLATLQMVLKLKNEKGLNTTAIRMALDNLTSGPEEEPLPSAPAARLPDIHFITQVAETIQEQSELLLRQTEKIEDRIKELERKLEEQERVQTDKLDELLRLWKSEPETRAGSWLNRIWKK
jgi:DNA-binding transcriptional MerR regulator